MRSRTRAYLVLLLLLLGCLIVIVRMPSFPTLQKAPISFPTSSTSFEQREIPMESNARITVASEHQEYETRTLITPTIYLPIIPSGRTRSILPTFGLHVFDYQIGNAEARRLAIEAGISWISGIWLSWQSIESGNCDLINNPQSGDWSAYDNIFSNIVEASGLIPLVEVNVNPPWAASTDCGPIDIAPLSEFAEFVWAAAERYDGDGDYDGDGLDEGPAMPHVKYWEFYNEPDFDPDNAIQLYDHGGCFGNNGAAYAEMLRAVYPAIKDANPEAQVVFGGVAHDRFTPESRPQWYPQYWEGPFNYSFINDVLVHLDTHYGSEQHFPYFDIMNFHNYNDFCDAWDGPNLPYDQDLIGKAKYLRENILAPYGLSEMPLICSEVGIPSAPTDQWTERSEELQSIYVLQAFVRGMAAKLLANIWFTMTDFEHELGSEYGLLKRYLTPKSAYEAYRVLTTELAGASYDRQLITAETGSANIEAYRSTMEDGGKKIVLWTDTGERLGKKGVPPITRTMVFTGVHFDGEWTGQLRVVDKLGNERIESGSSYISIDITQSPIYVEVAP